MNYTQSLPKFTKIDIDSITDVLQKKLKANLDKIEHLLSSQTHYTWDNLLQPIEMLENDLEKFWAPISHLHSVKNTKALRTHYQACISQLSAYQAALGQNKALFHAIKSINPDTLNPVQQKIRNDMLTDFRLSGIDLPYHSQKEFEAIQLQLSELSNQFDNNLLDAVQAYHYQVVDEKRLEGLPTHAIQSAKHRADEKNMDGWIFNLEYPSYLAVMTYADDASLREQLYFAFATRASDVGPNKGEFDNSSVMLEILKKRQQKAKLLGFSDYAALSLETKMAPSCAAVIDFLNQLLEKSHPQGEAEYNALQQFAKERLALNTLNPWDIAYVSEKMKSHLFGISQEQLRLYFPLQTVLSGMFTIIHTLYGMTFKPLDVEDVWDEAVRVYEVCDSKQASRGYVYIDLFARPYKKGGAWMDGMQSRLVDANQNIQPPIATLTCNFAKTSSVDEAYLSHDEVLTLFHEMGHCLHHVLTQVDYLSASGINGVEWDAVELPSQFFENWCWHYESLALLTCHRESQEKLPKEIFEQLLASKHFQSGLSMLRQIEFSLFDFNIHQYVNTQNTSFIAEILENVRHKTAILKPASYNRFQHSFSHIFAGGYAAGYYSYKWAEVLSSDAFSSFKAQGIFNQSLGLKFLHQILEVGGSRPAMESFEAFQGRKPTTEALLEDTGII